MAKVEITKTETFTSTHYVCDNEDCSKQLIRGWKGHACFVCRGNFCEQDACIADASIPGYGHQYICCYCRVMFEDCAQAFAKIESDRAVILDLWRVGTKSPALHKEQ